MRYAPIIAFLAVILLAGCRSKDALNFSENIVKIERKLGESVQEAQPDISRYMQDGIYDSLALLSGDIVKKTEASIEEINAMKAPDIPEAATFKATAVKYFTHVRNIYDSYKVYAEQPNDSLRATEVENMIRLEEGIDDLTKELQEAQRKFAKASGFRVESE